jgi:hypothetical protein
VSTTFNEKHGLQMKSFVAKKLKNGQARVERGEIEAVGANMGLNHEDSALLFESLEGAHWRGTYLALDEQKRWTAVSVSNVS